MKSEHRLLVIPIIIVLLLSGPLCAQDPYVGEFGVTEGKHIDDGFVFLDGRYIESPYRVSRKGLVLYINNSKVDRPTRHMETPVLSGYENPENLSVEQRPRRGPKAGRQSRPIKR